MHKNNSKNLVKKHNLIQKNLVGHFYHKLVHFISTLWGSGFERTVYKFNFICEDVYFKAHICAVRSFQGIYLFMPHMLFYLACNFLNAAETAKCHSLQLFARLSCDNDKNKKCNFSNGSHKWNWIKTLVITDRLKSRNKVPFDTGIRTSIGSNLNGNLTFCLMSCRLPATSQIYTDQA